MQHFIPALVAALLASALTVMVLEVVSIDDPAPEEVVVPSPAGGFLPSDASDPETDLLVGADAGPRVRELEMRVATLENRLADLSETRQPVITEEMREKAASLSGGEAVDFVLDVIAQKEEEERRQREEEQRRRNEERLLRESDRIAEALGLTGGEKDALFGVLVEESTRRTDAMEAMRDSGGPANRDEMRNLWSAVSDWKEQALAEKLGADLAGKVQEWQRENSRGGRGGRGGFGGGGFGGRGGGGGR